MLAGRPIAEIQAAATSAPDDGQIGDRGIYILGDETMSVGRVGNGLLHDRPAMHVASYLIRLSSVPDKIQRRWPITQETFAMLEANGGRGWYVVLADNLSKTRATAGEQAVFNLLGLRRDGGWLLSGSFGRDDA
jgi:hypothetical protein